MSKLCFLTNNLVDNAALSLSAGTVNAQFPLGNIKKTLTTQVFRSLGDTVKIVFDLGSTFPLDTIALTGDAVSGLLGFNTASLKGSGSLDFSSSTAYPIDLSHKYNFGFKQFTGISNRYWELTLTGTTYVQVSNIYLGQATRLSNNDISTTSFAWDETDRVDIQTNKYGQKFINEYNTIFSLSGDISLINADEYAIISEVAANHKRRKPLWFILDPEGAMSIEDSQFLFSGYFYFTKDFKWKTTTTGIYSTSLDIEEVI